jgi:hypothetical protein
MKQSSNGIISANDPTGFVVSANLTIGDSVSRAGDLPSSAHDGRCRDLRFSHRRTGRRRPSRADGQAERSEINVPS